MHARMICRNLTTRRRRLGLFALLLGCTQLLLLGLASPPAHSAINVSYIQINQQNSFLSSRTYAGQSVAARSVELAFKLGGEIESLNVDLGDHVRPGQVLGSLDMATLNTRLQQAQADVALAKANLMAQDAETQLAGNTEQRLRALREKGHVSQQTYDEARLMLRARQAQLNVARANVERATAARNSVQVDIEDAVIAAPFGGIIQARYVDEGAQVAAGQATLRLVDESAMEAHVGVPASFAERLTPGTVYRLGWNNREHQATLRAVLPELDQTTRTLTAVLKLHDSSIPLGSVVELRLAEDITSPGFWLPVSALSASDRGLWGVYVINDANIIERRLVEVIHTESDRAYVRGTLNHLDRVVQTGVQRIVPGQPVVPTPASQQANYAR